METSRIGLVHVVTNYVGNFVNLVVAIPFTKTYEATLVHVGTNFGNFTNLT
jgi:hypothetical protein